MNSPGSAAHNPSSHTPQPAPLWHFILVMGIILLPPMRTFLGSYPHGSNRHISWFRVAYFDLCASSAIFLFVWLGLRLRHIKIREIVYLSWRNQFSRVWSYRSVGLIFFVNLAVGLVLIFDGAYSSPVPRFPPVLSVADLAFAVFVSLTAGLLEEFLCRGYLLRQFELWTGNLLHAAILQALIFSLAHGLDQTVFGYFDKFASGIVFAWAAIRYGSLVPAMIAHFIFDATMFGVLFLLRHHVGG